MPKQDLGRLKVVPLHEVFDDEPGDFSPWLYENLDLLGDAIQLDLIPVEREGKVGALSVDIVAESELGVVVIENQIRRSDHDHLGKLLSYGAGREALFLVWVAQSFKDEHLEALGWLNRWLPEDIEAHAVEVGFVQIDGSQPAPVFRALASPDGLSRQTGSLDSPDQISGEESTLRVAFFEQLVIDARGRGINVFKRSRTAEKSKSFPCSAGEDGIKYWVDLHRKREDGVTVKLDVRSEDRELNAAIVMGLTEQEIEIEQELGFKPQFVQAGRMAGRVQVDREGSVFDPPEEVEQLRVWIVDTISGFQSVLDPRVAAIVNNFDAKEAAGVEENPGGDNID